MIMACTIKGSDIISKINSDLDRATSMAINRATTTTVAKMKDVIANKYTIKKKDIKSHTAIIKANRNRKESSIYVPHQPLGLIYFSARQTKKGVTYAILKGQRKLRAHAFILNVSRNAKLQVDGDKRQVFERYGEKVMGMRKGWNGKIYRSMRQRIRVVTGLSIAQLFLGKRGNEMQKELGNTFKTEAREQLLVASKYLIGKR